MKPIKTSIIPLATGEALTDWRIASAVSAVQNHDLGDLFDSGRLADAMTADPWIGGLLSTRVRALAARSALPFTIEPGPGDKRRAESIAKQVEALWWDALPEPVVSGILRDAIMLGVAVGQIEWIEQDGQRLPRLRPLPAHGLRFQEWEQKWVYQTTTGPVDVTPNDGSWFLHLPNGEMSWRQGAVRGLWIPYIGRRQATGDWLRYCELHGLPQLAVKEPFFAEDDVGKESVTAFYDQFRRLGREAVLRLPQGSSAEQGGWSAEWLELTAGGWQAYQAVLRRFDSDASIVLHGRDTDSATKALGGDGETARDRVRVEFLASDAEPLSTSLRDQVWRWWGRYNVTGWSDDLTPWAKWNTRPPVDLARRATTLNTVADAIGKLKELGANTTALLDEFQIPRGGPTLNPPAGDEVDVNLAGL